jgi:putative endonuclease
MLTDTQIAKSGEDAADKYLRERGYRVVDRNVDLPMGELDIVTEKGGRYVFIEVKTSLETHRSFFHPEERVDKRKRSRLQALCETYLLRKDLDPKHGWQVDVIAVTLDREGNTLHIDHIENAVWDTRGV